MKQNYKKRILSVLFTIALLAITTVTYTNQNGPSAGLTGAPGESNCSSCHSGTPITSGTDFSNISLTGLPAGGYAPGVNYTLTFNGGSAALSKNGFQLTALSPSNAAAGSFAASTGSQAFIGSGRNYIGHTSSGTSQSQWTFSWTAPSSGVGTITFYAVLNATNASNSVVGDIVYLKTFTCNAGNLPVASITSPAPNSVFCAGDSVQFTGSATNNPTSFAWDFFGNNPNSSNLQNPKIRFNNPGFFTVRFRATNSSGTSTNAQITIQVVAKPTASISPAINQTICGGDSVTLTANSGTNLSYLWTPGNKTTQSIKVGSAGSYTVRVSSAAANCSTTSAPVTMTVAAKPSLSADLSNNILCIGDSIEIVATPGLQNYKYYLGSTLADSSSNSTVKFKIANSFTNIYIIGSNGICNSDPIVKTVAISTKPAAPAINCGPIFSNSVAFTITGSNPEISLDSGKTFMTPNQGSTHVINGLSPNTQILAYARTTTSAPCLYSLSSNKTCASANCTPLTLSVKAPKYICEEALNKDNMIRIISTNAVNPYFKYDFPPPILGSGWTKSDSFPASALLPGSQVFRVTVIDSANAFCPTKDTSFTINFVNFLLDNPTLKLDKAQYCDGDLITFDVISPNSIVNKVKYYTVIGSNRTEFAAKAKPDYMYGPVPLSPNFPNGTIVTVQTIDTVSGCGLFSTNKTIIVNPLPNVGFTYAKTNLQVVLTDTTSNTVNRRWIIEGDTFPATTTTYTHTFLTAGNKTVIMEAYTPGNCVGSTSVQINIVASGLMEAANSMGMELFPNPASNEVTVSWANGGNGSIELFDLGGKLVLTAELGSGNKLNLSGINKGVYLLKLSTQDQSAYKKLMVE
jgi:PKD repeat protein